MEPWGSLGKWAGAGRTPMCSAPTQGATCPAPAPLPGETCVWLQHSGWRWRVGNKKRERPCSSRAGGGSGQWVTQTSPPYCLPLCETAPVNKHRQGGCPESEWHWCERQVFLEQSPDPHRGFGFVSGIPCAVPRLSRVIKGGIWVDCVFSVFYKADGLWKRGNWMNRHSESASKINWEKHWTMASENFWANAQHILLCAFGAASQTQFKGLTEHHAGAACALPSLACSQPSFLSALMSLRLRGQAGQLPHLPARSLFKNKNKR